MGSQFVDLDADGKLDYVTATFDGSPHVAYGTGDGFAEPEHLLDANGARILLKQYWDYDARKWTDTDFPSGHCTSAVVFDQDADGDFDLLLGDYKGGNLYLRRNLGEPGHAKFGTENEPVLAGGKPFALEGGVSAPRLVDWDGDGLTDLVIGSFGSSWTAEPPGGVYLFKNVGKAGAPEFAAATALIPPTKTRGHEQERPNVGLYADPVDYDGDGDLDLVVGGYSIWEPAQPELDAAQRARVAELEAEIEAADASMRALVDEAAAEAARLDEEERRAHRAKVFQSAAYQAARDSRRKLGEELETLVPKRQRKAGVWVYLQEQA